MLSLAIVAAANHFDYYLDGTSFNVFTDHKACEFLLSSEKLNNRLSRMSLKLKSKEIKIIYKPDKANGNADGLSQQDFDMDGE